jgi:thiol-disulfide isomerase/thioredoxin
MHQPPHLVRRSALGMLATWPLGMAARRASAASPAPQRVSAGSPEAQRASAASPPLQRASAASPEAQRVLAASPEARQAEALALAEFTDPQGVPHRLSELTRPLLLVNLWAAWCPGCLAELPTIRALASLLGPDAIDVVLLSHAMNWPGDQAYARRASLPFRHWRLSAGMPESIAATAFRIEADRFALPQSLVFAGRDRVLVRSEEGSQDWTAPDQVRLARAWLAAAG